MNRHEFEDEWERCYQADRRLRRPRGLRVTWTIGDLVCGILFAGLIFLWMGIGSLLR